MKKYLAYDAGENEYESFETIEQARAWLKEGFLQDGEGYHPDTESCKIYELKETVTLTVVDEKKNYKYQSEEDAPEGEEDDVWPYDNAFDTVSKHEFKPV